MPWFRDRVDDYGGGEGGAGGDGGGGGGSGGDLVFLDLGVM